MNDLGYWSIPTGCSMRFGDAGEVVASAIAADTYRPLRPQRVVRVRAALLGDQGKAPVRIELTEVAANNTVRVVGCAVLERRVIDGRSVGEADVSWPMSPLASYRLALAGTGEVELADIDLVGVAIHHYRGGSQLSRSGRIKKGRLLLAGDVENMADEAPTIAGFGFEGGSISVDTDTPRGTLYVAISADHAALDSMDAEQVETQSGQLNAAIATARPRLDLPQGLAPGAYACAIVQKTDSGYSNVLRGVIGITEG